MKYLFVVGLFGLAACGPGDVTSTANQAATLVASAVPGAAQTAAALLPPGAAATAAALVPAGADQTAAAIANDPTVQALANEALTTIQGLVPSDLKLNKDQKLVLDTTKQVADVTNYRWVIVEAPASAAAVRGKVIGENSNGKLSIDPADYSKYFPVAGSYTVDLELTYTGGKKEIARIPITVP